MNKWMVVRVLVSVKEGSEPVFELDMRGPYDNEEQANIIRDEAEWHEQVDEAVWLVAKVLELAK